MSGEEDQNNGNQGGQPPQGGQPQGGQQASGQPQGQRAPGGQPPQGGQPAAGQPAQGGQAYGQGYQPGLGDKLQQPAVKSQIIKGVGIFGSVGIGLLVLAFLPDALSDAGLAFTLGAAFVTLGIGPVIAVQTGLSFGDLNVEQNTALAGSYIAGAVGYFVLALLALIGVQISSIGGSGSGGATGGGGLGSATAGLGDLFVPLILAALAIGVASVAATYLERNY
jgi:hypothetical protein